MRFFCVLIGLIAVSVSSSYVPNGFYYIPDYLCEYKYEYTRYEAGYESNAVAFHYHGYHLTMDTGVDPTGKQTTSNYLYRPDIGKYYEITALPIKNDPELPDDESLPDDATTLRDFSDEDLDEPSEEVPVQDPNDINNNGIPDYVWENTCKEVLETTPTAGSEMATIIGAAVRAFAFEEPRFTISGVCGINEDMDVYANDMYTMFVKKPADNEALAPHHIRIIAETPDYTDSVVIPKCEYALTIDAETTYDVDFGEINGVSVAYPKDALGYGIVYKIDTILLDFENVWNDKYLMDNTVYLFMERVPEKSEECADYGNDSMAAFAKFGAEGSEKHKYTNDYCAESYVNPLIAYEAQVAAPASTIMVSMAIIVSALIAMFTF